MFIIWCSKQDLSYSGNSAHNVSTIELYHLLQKQFCEPLRAGVTHLPVPGICHIA